MGRPPNDSSRAETVGSHRARRGFWRSLQGALLWVGWVVPHVERITAMVTAAWSVVTMGTDRTGNVVGMCGVRRVRRHVVQGRAVRRAIAAVQADTVRTRSAVEMRGIWRARNVVQAGTVRERSAVERGTEKRAIAVQAGTVRERSAVEMGTERRGMRVARVSMRGSNIRNVVDLSNGIPKTTWGVATRSPVAAILTTARGGSAVPTAMRGRGRCVTCVTGRATGRRGRCRCPSLRRAPRTCL